MWGTAARAQASTPFPYVGNGWTDCTEVWCVIREPLAIPFTRIKWNIFLRAHVRTTFPNPVNAGRHVLKFGVFLDML